MFSGFLFLEILLGVLSLPRTLIQYANAGVNTPDVLLASSPPKSKNKISDSLENLLEKMSSTVVAIKMERIKDFPSPNFSNGQIGGGLSEEDLKDLTDYFKRPRGPVTGLLLDQKGHVLTSLYNLSKVVKNIRVVFSNGREFPAKIISQSKTDDLVLLKIIGRIPEEIKIPEIPWGNAQDIIPGKIVLALGKSPDPTQITATHGIISAPARNHGRLFQTDAALNYGNTGGPIMGLEGQILGISSFVGHNRQWGFNSGIGFVVRADRIQKILNEMIAGKDIPAPEVPFLGVGPNREKLDDPDAIGAEISEVVPGSGAARGGIQVKDIILEFDGKPVEDFTKLRRLIYTKKPGESVKLKVLRTGNFVDLIITLGKRDG